MLPMTDESEVDRWVARYPSAEMTFGEFEDFVAELLRAGEPGLSNFNVTVHDIVQGVDGTYDFDATVRYSVLGMDFLVVVEAKFHSNPIKRELVQILHSKQLSVGAHKALLVSTSPFQRGAINYAKTHGVALATVTEGRFTYETRSAHKSEPLTRSQASDDYGISTFVAVYVGAADTPESTMIAVVDPADAATVQELLLAVPPAVSID